MDRRSVCNVHRPSPDALLSSYRGWYICFQALVDGPTPVTGVQRQLIPFKRLRLTDIKVNVLRNAREKQLKKAFEDENVLAQWEATAWAKKLAAKKKRAATSDFDRFKVMVARKQKSRIIAKKLAQLKKSS